MTDYHKINNLIATIAGYGEMMRDQVTDEIHNKWLTEIIVAAKGVDWLLRHEHKEEFNKIITEEV